MKDKDDNKSTTQQCETISLTVFGYMAIHPRHRPFCIEMGVPHGDFEIVEYKEKHKWGYKNIKCKRCGRLLEKNGKLVKQRSFPDYVQTEFDRFGYAYLDKPKSNEKTW